MRLVRTSNLRIIIAGPPVLACGFEEPPISGGGLELRLRRYPERGACTGVRLLAEAVGARHGGGSPRDTWLRADDLVLVAEMKPPVVASWSGCRINACRSLRPFQQRHIPDAGARVSRPASGASRTFGAGATASAVDAPCTPQFTFRRYPAVLARQDRRLQFGSLFERPRRLG